MNLVTLGSQSLGNEIIRGVPLNLRDATSVGALVAYSLMVYAPKVPIVRESIRFQRERQGLRMIWIALSMKARLSVA